MDIYAFDPLRDERWPDFVGQHPHASVFHTAAWLRALERTYHFTPLAFTTSPPDGELKNAVVLSALRSWLTGPRLVSRRSRIIATRWSTAPTNFGRSASPCCGIGPRDAGGTWSYDPWALAPHSMRPCSS